VPPVESEPEQKGERRAAVHYPAQNVSFMIGYKAPSVTSPDLPALDVLSSGEAVWNASIEDVPAAHDRDNLKKLGTRANAVIPLAHGGRVVGALSRMVKLGIRRPRR